MPSMNPQPPNPQPQPQPPEATKPPQKHVAPKRGHPGGRAGARARRGVDDRSTAPEIRLESGRAADAAGEGGRRRQSAAVRADSNAGPVFAKLTGPVSVAIVSGVGPDVPPDVAGATLMQALQATPGVRLVERDRLRQILSELQLGNAGVSDASRALRLGRIVAADLMVMLTAHDAGRGPNGHSGHQSGGRGLAAVAGPSQAPAPPPPAPGLARVRVIDTRTGIILDRFELTAKSATDATGTAQRLQAALGRRAGRPGEAALPGRLRRAERGDRTPPRPVRRVVAPR